MSIDQVVARIVSRVLDEAGSIGEVIAGSMEEKIVLDIIRVIVEETISAKPYLEPVPVAYWREKEQPLIEACGLTLRAVAWPGSPPADVEARMVHARPETSPRYWTRLGVEDSIVIVELPEEPDDADTIYMHVMENGGLGVVFYDKWPGRYRRIVVGGGWDYSYSQSPPLYIPVIHLRREDGLKLVARCSSGSFIRLFADTVVTESTGYNLVATVLDAGEEYVLVTAHHDHWFSGANDNLAGIAAALATLRVLVDELRGGAPRLGVRLVSFTAEEYGAPLGEAWYWSWGSRFYAKGLSELGVLDNIIAVLNFDMPSGRLLVHATGFELQSLIEKAASSRGINIDGIYMDSCYTDSFSFSSHGIPSASIIDLEGYMEYYHTDLDTADKLNIASIKKAVRLFSDVALELVRRGLEALDYTSYANRVFRIIVEEARAPPPLAASAYKLLRETEKLAEKHLTRRIAKAYRLLNSLGVKPIFEGDYRVSRGGFRNTFMPWLLVLRDYRKIGEIIDKLGDQPVEALREIAENVPSKIIIPGEEKVVEYLLQPLAKLENISAKQADFLLKAVLLRASRAYDKAVEESRSILERVFREMVLGELKAQDQVA